MTSSDMGDMWQDKLSLNGAQSTEILRQHGVIYAVHNGGTHLIVEGPSGYIDFWPGTGRWIVRGKKAGFGVKNLLAYMGIVYKAV